MKYDKDLTKYKFGKLTPIKISYINKNHVKIWECKYDGRKIGEVGDFGDEIINRRHSTPILPILCYLLY